MTRLSSSRDVGVGGGAVGFATAAVDLPWRPLPEADPTSLENILYCFLIAPVYSDASQIHWNFLSQNFAISK